VLKGSAETCRPVKGLCTPCCQPTLTPGHWPRPNQPISTCRSDGHGVENQRTHRDIIRQLQGCAHRASRPIRPNKQVVRQLNRRSCALVAFSRDKADTAQLQVQIRFDVEMEGDGVREAASCLVDQESGQALAVNTDCTRKDNPWQHVSFRAYSNGACCL
jgi:hypothetical protein